MMQYTRLKRNSAIDLMKFVLSIFVVMIHAEVKVGAMTPFLRCAVPLFFLTSGYYFFKKIIPCRSDADKRNVLGTFLKRNMILYGFWFVVLLPITLHVRNWFSVSILKGVFLFIQSFLFNSTFRASWYLMALNIGMCIILWLSKKLSAEKIVVLMLPIYMLCCISTNYYGVLQHNYSLLKIYHVYITYFRSISNSFPAALFWLALGRMIAERENTADNKKKGILVISISSVLLILEYCFVKQFNLQNGDDAYIMLIPLCVSAFLLIKAVPWNSKNHLRLGAISTMIYTTHASVIVVINAILKKIPVLGATLRSWLVFVVALIVCLCICKIVFALENKTLFCWLKYAY